MVIFWFLTAEIGALSSGCDIPSCLNLRPKGLENEKREEKGEEGKSLFKGINDKTGTEL